MWNKQTQKPSLMFSPYCSKALDGTPGLNLTGFESVVIVLDTSASPSAYMKVFQMLKRVHK